MVGSSFPVIESVIERRKPCLFFFFSIKNKEKSSGWLKSFLVKQGTEPNRKACKSLASTSRLTSLFSCSPDIQCWFIKYQ